MGGAGGSVDERRPTPLADGDSRRPTAAAPGSPTPADPRMTGPMAASATPLVLVSGFGPFEAFDRNPSGEVALALAARPPRGVRVRSGVLPVSFGRAPEALDELLDELLDAGERPALCLALGVAREAGFRLERFGGGALQLVPRPDVDGRTAHEFSREGAPLEAGVDLARLLAALRARGAGDAWISLRAGGYVCEHVYHHLLGRASRLGVPGLFVHVPPLRFTPLERQVEVIGWVLEELVLQSSSSSRG